MQEEDQFHPVQAPRSIQHRNHRLRREEEHRDPHRPLLSPLPRQEALSQGLQNHPRDRNPSSSSSSSTSASSSAAAASASSSSSSAAASASSSSAASASASSSLFLPSAGMDGLSATDLL
ncbi:hypothetical protein QJS04_geneDACA018331 [Acorus gramineus]|uniref:Uncharacterized protein n=1 Tax=Acorus gramineus TaxID=55184 RepID=A0AAV9BDA4_ACOGR|nr:hypothetical protein QJS04_geneDACA018331 [Acorus gramineus]